MNYIPPDIEKSNGLIPFRTWTGQLVVTVPCGGWRLATRLEATMLLPARRLVIVREEG